MNEPTPRASGGLDAKLSLRGLLCEEENQLLVAARDLGCAVSLVDRQGNAVVGDAPPAVVLAAPPESTPWYVREGGREYRCSAVYHNGEQLCRIVCSALPGPDGRTRGLRTAHYIIRLCETLLRGALRRTLTARVHLAYVEEAYCELQLKHQRLEQAVQRMKDSDRVKASFLATVSHELRTPLTSVLGYSEMLMEGLAGPLSNEQREYLQTVMDKGDQLLGLISKLLDVSRIEAAGVQLTRTAVDLHSLCAEVLHTVAPQCRRKRTQLTAALPPDLLLVDGDREKLRQVLVNLIANAVKFTPERGEVAVVAKNQEGEGPPKVQVSVLDSGIGIPTHLHEKVFELFYQIDNSATREYEGSGLGLSLVRKYVDAHQGEVWVENGPDRGAIFHLLLPAMARQ
jgi:signal transduction histidine kinase